MFLRNVMSIFLFQGPEPNFPPFNKNRLKNSLHQLRLVQWAWLVRLHIYLYDIVRLQQINRVLLKIWDFVYKILVGGKF